MLQSRELTTRGDGCVCSTPGRTEPSPFHGLRERIRPHAKTVVEFFAQLANRCAVRVETLVGKELAELAGARSRDSARVTNEVTEAAPSELHGNDRADGGSREHEQEEHEAVTVVRRRPHP